MELIRRNSDYALRSLIYMARFPKGKRFTVSVIAKRQNVPIAFLRKTLRKLSLKKIVHSQRGPSGGFYLSKRPSQISLKEILESAQGRISLSDCLFENSLCNHARTCKIKDRLSNIQKRFTDLLDDYTIEDFLR